MEIPFGKSTIAFDLPQDWEINWIMPPDSASSISPAAIIEEAFSQEIGSSLFVIWREMRRQQRLRSMIKPARFPMNFSCRLCLPGWNRRE